MKTNTNAELFKYMYGMDPVKVREMSDADFANWASMLSKLIPDNYETKEVLKLNWKFVWDEIPPVKNGRNVSNPLLVIKNFGDFHQFIVARYFMDLGEAYFFDNTTAEHIHNVIAWIELPEEWDLTVDGELEEFLLPREWG